VPTLHLPRDQHALLTCSTLTVVATLLGDAGQRYFRRAAIPGRGQIPEGDDAHEALLVVEHGQRPDLLRGHVLGKIIDVVVLEAVFHLSTHHVADRGFGTEPMGDTSHGDISVRDHSHHTIVVVDRQHADVALFISAAASRSIWLGLARQTSRVMISPTFIRCFFSSTRVFLLARAVPVAPSLSDDFLAESGTTNNRECVAKLRAITP
jgi:hypothetical protein